MWLELFLFDGLLQTDLRTDLRTGLRAGLRMDLWMDITLDGRIYGRHRPRHHRLDVPRERQILLDDLRASLAEAEVEQLHHFLDEDLEEAHLETRRREKVEVVEVEVGAVWTEEWRAAAPP